jgi:hypothetical protein
MRYVSPPADIAIGDQLLDRRYRPLSGKNAASADFMDSRWNKNSSSVISTGVSTGIVAP